MPLNAIVELFAGRRRDESTAPPDDQAHREGRPPLAAEQQVDAATIALMTAQAHGLIC